MKEIHTIRGKFGTVVMFRKESNWKNCFRNVGAIVINGNDQRIEIKPTRSIKGMIRRLHRLGFIV